MGYFSQGHIGANTTHRTAFPEHELRSTEIGNLNKRMMYVKASGAISIGACVVDMDTGIATAGAGAWVADAAFVSGEYGWVHRQDVGGTTLDSGDATVIPFYGLNVNAAGNAVVSIVAPFDGTIAKLRSILLGGALATGDATITAAIDGVNVTNGVITITQDGSAANDKDEATPSAAKTFTAGQTITLTVGGTATGDRTANVFMTLLRS